MFSQIVSMPRKKGQSRILKKRKMSNKMHTHEMKQLLLRGANKQLETLLIFSSYENMSKESICEDYNSLQSWNFELEVLNVVTTPKNIPLHFVIRQSTIPKVVLGVWTEVFLPKGVSFGPYKGCITKNCNDLQNTGYSWMLRNRDKTQNCLEGYYKEKSNWMRLVNCADREDKQNLLAYQYKNKLYFKTHKSVLPFQELLVWYGEKYALNLGLESSKNANALIKKEPDVFSCDVCHVLLFSREAMLEHRKAHSQTNRKRSYNCKECSYSTTSKCRLRDHLCVHNAKDKIFRCSHCDRVFHRSSSLSSHVRVHTAEKPFACDVCGRTFKWNQALRVHCRTHSGERPFQCATCGKDFIQLSNLKTHLRMHAALRPYKCLHCSYSSSQSQHLTQHVIVKHTKQFPFACAECGKGFIRPSRYRDHLGKKHLVKEKSKKQKLAVDDVEKKDVKNIITFKQEKDIDQLQMKSKKFKCSVCTYSSQRVRYLVKHVALKHTDAFPHKCVHCTKGFPALLDLNQHLIEKHSSLSEFSQNTERNISPKNKCMSTKDTKLKIENNKRRIMRGKNDKIHSPIKSVVNKTGIKESISKFRNTDAAKIEDLSLRKCQHCNYACEKSQNLSQHIIRNHSNRYPHKCPLCGKNFQRSARLIKHVESFHSEDKSIRMDSNKTASQFTWNSLKRKVIRIKVKSKTDQTDQKPYTCPHCSYACLRFNRLSRHIIEQHTRAYPFICPQCAEGFLRPAHLRDHFAQMHGNASLDGDQTFNRRDDKKDVPSEVRKDVQKLFRYKCPHCDYICFIAQELSQHVIAKHTSSRSYACCQCVKCFNSPIYLRRHFKKIHTANRDSGKTKADSERGEIVKKTRKEAGKSKEKKPFKCPHCQYKCSLKQNLSQHVIVRHTKKYPMSCSYCGKGFTRKNRLRHHLQKWHSESNLE